MTEYSICLSTGSFITDEETIGFKTPQELDAYFPEEGEADFHKAGASFMIDFFRYMLKVHGDDYTVSRCEGGIELILYFDDDGDDDMDEMLSHIEKRFKKHIKGNLLKIVVREGIYLP